MADCLYEDTFSHPTGNDGHTRFPSFLPSALPVEPQFALNLFFLAVALVAFANQYGPNFFFEKLKLSGISRPSRVGNHNQCCKKAIHLEAV